MGINIETIYRPLRSDGTETVLPSDLLQRIEATDPRMKLDLSPDYQRDYVWTDRQASQFVGHMIEGGNVGNIIVQRFPIRSAPIQPDEVIDGQQRLRSFYRWLRDEIPAELHTGQNLCIDDLDIESRRSVRGHWLTGPHFTFQYVSLPRAERLRLYLRLNRGGTAHTDAEIERVRALLAQEEGHV